MRRRSALVALGMCVVTALGCDTGPGGRDVTGPDEPDAAPIDTPGEVAVDSAPGDSGEVIEDLTAAVCEAPSFGGATALVGLSDLEGCYAALEAGATLEIVHGIQGGIHVELRLAIATPDVVGSGPSAPSLPTVTWDVEVSHDGTTLARFAATLGTFEALGPSSQAGQALWAWASPTFPVVFASADASLYHGLAAEVRATLDLDGRRQTLGPIPVHLVDPALLPPPR